MKMRQEKERCNTADCSLKGRERGGGSILEMIMAVNEKM